MAAKDDKPKDGKDILPKEEPTESSEPSVVVIDEGDAVPETAVERDAGHVGAPEAAEPFDVDETDPDPGLKPEISAEPPQTKRGGIWLPALSGAVAAIAVAVAFVVYETRPGGMLARDTQAIDELKASVLALEGQLETTITANDTLSAKLDAHMSDFDAAIDRLDTLDQALAETAKLSATMSGIETRLTDLENRPIPDIGATQDAVAAYETQLSAMRSMLESELQQIKDQAEQSASLQVNAADLQRQAAVENLATQLLVAIDEGNPYDDLLGGLSELGVDLPAELQSTSGGVVPSVKLAADFPPVARELVEADVREKVASGDIGRLEAFMRLQLGARSTAPKDGTDVEAIVARAEASLSQGDLATALRELEPLRANATTALAEWLMGADAHLAAVKAAKQITAAYE